MCATSALADKAKCKLFLLQALSSIKHKKLSSTKIKERNKFA